ncbi:MAG: phospho-sugar mutase [Chthoniobacteraceae bacterium]|nr:phospho-sugar mutase [Chthoniobacteraceae bacterium]
MNTLSHRIQAVVAAGHLPESSARNITQLLARSSSPVDHESIAELVDAGAWSELNDRFFRTLAFGTGGLRGRTIGKIVTAAEQGTPQALDRPEHPCVGTNAMNFFNISRATQGLVAYLHEWFAKEKLSGKPKIVIAHDTRHFSRDFAELSAKVASELGVDVCLFTLPRSTPELSFAVRAAHATAGIVITASHNPPHDNGYKVYFADGGQVIEPHATGIIRKVNATESDVYEPVAPEKRGTVQAICEEIDNAYMARLETLILDRSLIEKGRELKIIFTPIHGTGGEISCPMLARLGFQFSVVPQQAGFDGRFPTVKSPNPENAEALTLAIKLANEQGADLVLATDPDCDRMGVALRNAKGEMQLITGNQIGSLLAWYRSTTLLRQGVLNAGNLKNAVIIKTFVTTDLQKAIAGKFGIRCVETLTGFKYIGAKLTKYERALPAEIQANYVNLPEAETRALRLDRSSYYVFGGEESYGYSGSDFVRDKDANSATVMFCEVAAYAKSRGITLDVLLDEIYAEFGYYLEQNGNLVFEGAEGAAKIKRLAESYAANPPKTLDGSAVTALTNFGAEEIRDVEGDLIPKEAMLIFTLADGRRVAVRPSGTEPKIKFYLFGRRDPQPGQRFTAEELAAIKPEVKDALGRLWEELKADVDHRLA